MPTKNQLKIQNLKKEIASLEEKIEHYKMLIEEKKQLLEAREASNERFQKQRSNTPIEEIPQKGE